MSARPSNCPDCGEDLPAKAGKCRCGWKWESAATPAATAKGEARDDRCEHEEVLGQRCPNRWTWRTRAGRFCGKHGPEIQRSAGTWRMPIPDHVRAAVDQVRRTHAKPEVPDFDSVIERAAIQAEERGK